MRSSMSKQRFANRAVVGVATLSAMLVIAGTAWGADSPGHNGTLSEKAVSLLSAKCSSCHGDKKRESGLDLRTTAGAIKGGESGPAIVPGDAEKSLLYERLVAGEMPPREEDRLKPDEIALVREWINQAALASAAAAADDFAKRKDHWSLAYPVRPEVPEIATPEGDTAANPIDAFVLAKLRNMNLSAAPLADRRTLARRAYFDLLGLPPTPEQVDEFVRDADPKAYEKLIDRLLASPHYGERWARHWLDVARYADTGGYETDIYFKNAWRYRDYVVKSFNDDKPYDVFVQEQVAGDELWPDDLELDGSYVMPPEKLRHLEARTGTGLYALGPQIHESNMDAKKIRYERLGDWVDTTGAAFLGLTIGCARCHDHKFDCVTQRDYYGLQAVFAASREVESPIVNGMEIADQKQHYPRILAVDEARRAYRLFELSLAGRTATPEEEKRRGELLAAIGRAVLAMPEKAASTPGTTFDGLMEIPTVSVLGHVEPELVPAIYLLGRGDLARPKEEIKPALPAVLAEKTGAIRCLPGPSAAARNWPSGSPRPTTRSWPGSW